MSRNYYRKTKDLTVVVANPKTPEEYGKMIDKLNDFFKKYYGNPKNIEQYLKEKK